MTLLEALVDTMKDAGGVEGARLAHFAFSHNGSNAYLSQIERDELVPLLEEWCKQQRNEMGTVH